VQTRISSALSILVPNIVVDIPSPPFPPSRRSTSFSNPPSRFRSISSPNPSHSILPSDPELDMLGYALGYRDDESRLGCQVIVSEEIGGWCEGGGEFGLPRY